MKTAFAPPRGRFQHRPTTNRAGYAPPAPLAPVNPIVALEGFETALHTNKEPAPNGATYSEYNRLFLFNYYLNCDKCIPIIYEGQSTEQFELASGFRKRLGSKSTDQCR